LLGKFAREAILHQPGAYLGAVLADYGRIVGLHRARPGDGADPATMRFDLQVPFGGPAPTAQGVAAYYKISYSSIRVLPLPYWAHRLARYQGIFRLHEGLILPLMLLAVAGAVAARGMTRRGIVLFLASAVALYAFPPIVALWDVRYGVLPGELLVLAAATGGASLVSRWRDRLAASVA
jgi:hypothetical protein